MARPHAVLLALLAGFAGAASCYSDRLPPPTFRYVCDTTADCNEGESCIDGLCQIPCTLATFADDCPPEGSYSLCFNGVCSHVCELAGGLCAAGQTCIDPGFDLAGLFGDGGGGGGGGSDEELTLGICGETCDADSCPMGEACLEGFCFATCDPANDTCAAPFACVGGYCLPDFGDGADGGSTESSGSDGGADSTDGDGTGTSSGGT